MSRTFLIAVAAATLAAAAAHAEPKQGGEMVVTYKDDISTFDPAIGYDWQNWSMIKSLFDEAHGLQARHDRADPRPR
jgi:ABC-type transport system substrate-binding protein